MTVTTENSTHVPEATTGRLEMLRNSELDCLIALDDLAHEMTTCTEELIHSLRAVRAEIRSLERVAA
jgi:hypothetical protein